MARNSNLTSWYSANLDMRSGVMILESVLSCSLCFTSGKPCTSGGRTDSFTVCGMPRLARYSDGFMLWLEPEELTFTEPEELTFTGDGADVLVAAFCNFCTYSEAETAGASYAVGVSLVLTAASFDFRTSDVDGGR